MLRIFTNEAYYQLLSHFPPVSFPPSQMNFLLKVGLIQLLGFSYSHGLGVILSSAHSTYLGDLGKL